MADNSKIGWTQATWNPVTGCTKVSPGCDHCYAETFAERWRGIPGHHFEAGFDVTLRPERLDQPLRWKRSRMIFVNSMSDLFHDKVPDDFIARAFAVMAEAQQHTFQLLTKRHARMRSLLSSPAFRENVYSYVAEGSVRPWQDDDSIWPLPNVWVGVSVENQQWADIRVPALLRTPAAVRWLSCEPLLGPVNLRDCDGLDVIDYLDWVVVGGESGRGARPMAVEWAQLLLDQCAAAEVPAFFKQTGSVLAKQLGLPGKGEDVDTLPESLRVREYPAVAEAVAA
jgi:protein gp37